MIALSNLSSVTVGRKKKLSTSVRVDRKKKLFRIIREIPLPTKSPNAIAKAVYLFVKLMFVVVINYFLCR